MRDRKRDISRVPTVQSFRISSGAGEEVPRFSFRGCGVAVNRPIIYRE